MGIIKVSFNLISTTRVTMEECDCVKLRAKQRKKSERSVVHQKGYRTDANWTFCSRPFQC